MLKVLLLYYKTKIKIHKSGILFLPNSEVGGRRGEGGGVTEGKKANVGRLTHS